MSNPSLDPRSRFSAAALLPFRRLLPSRALQLPSPPSTSPSSGASGAATATAAARDSLMSALTVRVTSAGVPKLVRVVDFADTLGSSDESVQSSARDAETIYLIIQEYDRRALLAVHFEEHLDLLGLSFYDAVSTDAGAGPERGAKRGAGRPEKTGGSGGQPGLLRRPPVDSAAPENPPVHPEPAPRASSGASLSSGELLTQLEERRVSEASTALLPRARLPPELVAGLSSESELPVTVYSVHDRDSRPTRWSVHERQQRQHAVVLAAPPTAPAPTYRSTSGSSGSSEPRSGGGVARAVLVGSAGYAEHLLGAEGRHAAFEALMVRDSSADGASSAVASVGGGKRENSVGFVQTALGPFGGGGAGAAVGAFLGLPHLPHLPHFDRFDAYGRYEKAGDFGVRHGTTELYVPWTRWAVVMLCGLLAAPVYFMVALGFFDYGGFLELQDLRILPDTVEKQRVENVRYFCRYTRAQKVVSLAIGVFWIAAVVSMIVVGFVVALRRKG